MKEQIKYPKNSVDYTIQKQWKRIVVSCKKNTASKNPSIRRNKQNRLMLVLDCAACGKKK